MRDFDHKGCRAVFFALACFWIAVIATGYSVWPETVMGANR